MLLLIDSYFVVKKQKNKKKKQWMHLRVVDLNEEMRLILDMEVCILLLWHIWEQKLCTVFVAIEGGAQSLTGIALWVIYVGKRMHRVLKRIPLILPRQF